MLAGASDKGVDQSLAVCFNASFLGVFAHAGFLLGLEESGIRPGNVAGSSAGAVIAALYAHGVSPAEIVSRIREHDLRRVFLDAWAPVRAAGMLLAWRGVTGAVDPLRAIALLREWFGDQQIESCPAARLGVGVTNLTDGCAATLERGLLREAVLASCSLPGLFVTRQIAGAHYSDGGWADPEPVGHWLRQSGVQRIIVHRIFAPPRQPSRPGVNWVFSRGRDAMIERCVSSREDAVRASGRELLLAETIITPPPLGFPLTPRRFTRWDEACDARIAAGRASAAALAPALLAARVT